MLIYQTYTTLPPEPLLTSLLNLLTTVFTNQTRSEWLTDLTHKATTYPAFQVLLALDGERVVGCKLGYERDDLPPGESTRGGLPRGESTLGTFYSWLGCVDPAYRGRGIAAALMQRQHDDAHTAGYVRVRTHTYNQWLDMLILNLRHGFEIVGTQPGKHGLTILLEKTLLFNGVALR